MADTKLSALTAAATLGDDDELFANDSGVSKKITVANMRAVMVNDAELVALAGLTSAANKGIMFTGSGTAAVFDLTPAGLALLDDTAAINQRATLELGTIATQAASAVTITGGSVTGITDITVADGGTGVSTLTGIVKGNGTSAFSAASAGTDYYAPGSTDVAVADGGTGASTLTGILKGNGTSAFTAATQGTDFWAPGGTDVAVADGGTGASTLTGILKGNGTSAFTAASAGTDYYAPGSTDVAVADGGTGASTLTGIVKGNGTSAFTAASAGTDYYNPGGTDVAVADGGTGASTAAAARSNLGMANRTVASGLSGVPTATAGAAPITRVGGSTPVENVYQGWAFDQTTDEMVDFGFCVPAWFPGSTGVTVKFWTVTTATANDMVFQAAFSTTNGFDIDGDASYSYQSSGVVTTSGTSGIPTRVSIAFTSAQIDSFAAGDFVILRVRRDADNTSAVDGVAADVILLEQSLIIEES